MALEVKKPARALLVSKKKRKLAMLVSKIR
jgi:hypothetical protein